MSIKTLCFSAHAHAHSRAFLDTQLQASPNNEGRERANAGVHFVNMPAHSYINARICVNEQGYTSNCTYISVLLKQPGGSILCTSLSYPVDACTLNCMCAWALLRGHCLHMHKQAHLCTHMHTLRHTCTHVHAHARACTQCTPTLAHRLTQAHTHTHAHAHMHKHSQTHTYTHSLTHGAHACTHTGVRISPSASPGRAQHMHTHIRTRTLTLMRTLAHIHTHAQARAHLHQHHLVVCHTVPVRVRRCRMHPRPPPLALLKVLPAVGRLLLPWSTTGAMGLMGIWVGAKAGS